MDFTPRMKQIFQVLLGEQQPISVQNLAQQVGVSKRTVQRELESAGSCLKGYGISFMSKTGVGVWLEGEPEKKKQLRSALKSGDNYDVTNREERRRRLILEILKEKGLKKMYYYSSRFGVSEATVSTDLEAVQDWLAQYGLCVKRKPGSGICVEGSEENYRRAIRAFIHENIDSEMLRESYEDIGNGGELKTGGIEQILKEDTMQRVRDCIAGMQHERIRTMTENSYNGLVLHVAIAVNRIVKNETIAQDASWQEQLGDDEDYRLAQELTDRLADEFHIEIPPVETAYICLHIKGAKHERIQWDGESNSMPNTRGMRQLVNAMIAAFDKEKAVLLCQDDEFIQGLFAHLQPTLIRLKYGMHIQNPMLSEIKADYPDIYARCLSVAKVLEEETGSFVPEEEIGFLTVHFGAAAVRLEGNTERIRRVHVGVVCSSGIGISRLMSSKLAKVFKERMQLGVYGKNDVTPYLAAKTDFFVSSVPLDIETPVVYVNPLLNKEDMDAIARMAYKYERMPARQHEEDAFGVQLEEINLIATQIRTVIRYMEFFRVDHAISFDELLIAIGEQLSPYSDRREMIREDIMKREQIASQIFAEFGFALFHARSRGVIRPSFAVCMTKDLGRFEHPELKGIDVAFIMLVPIDEHLKINTGILGYISSMLIEEPDFMETVHGGDREQIRDSLSRHLKKYFNRYLSGLS